MTKAELLERVADLEEQAVDLADVLRSTQVNFASLQTMAKNYERECVRLTAENVALREGLALPVPSERCPVCGAGLPVERTTLVLRIREAFPVGGEASDVADAIERGEL
jgi:hypothetical protein